MNIKAEKYSLKMILDNLKNSVLVYWRLSQAFTQIECSLPRLLQYSPTRSFNFLHQRSDVNFPSIGKYEFKVRREEGRLSVVGCWEWKISSHSDNTEFNRNYFKIYQCIFYSGSLTGWLRRILNYFSQDFLPTFCCTGNAQPSSGRWRENWGKKRQRKIWS